MIPKHEDNRIWNAFEKRWKFAPSYHSGIGIVEHGDFLTISIADLSETQIEKIGSIEEILIRSIGYPVYALDWQHESYKINSIDESRSIPLSIYPDGDYYIYLDSKAENGSFGHPWRETICFLGPKVVCALGDCLMQEFPILRSGTQQGAQPDAFGAG